MIIPSYPSARALELDDKSFFDNLFHSLQPSISEFSFGNLFLFRRAHDYRLSKIGDSHIILGRSYDGREYFLPTLSGETGSALEILFGDGLCLYGGGEDFLVRYLSDAGDLEICEDRDSFDYLYLRQDLAELPGNRYHKKKNRINYFTTRHNYSVEAFSREHVDGVVRLLREWYRIRSSSSSRSLPLEVEAAEEGAHMAEQLGLEGLVVLVEGEVRAYVLGERLNRFTSVCHFEKADPFIEGLYQVADREFNRRCFTDCMYVNREQDLGEASLRKSKLSYHPVELVKKFYVQRKI